MQVLWEKALPLVSLLESTEVVAVASTSALPDVGPYQAV